MSQTPFKTRFIPMSFSFQRAGDEGEFRELNRIVGENILAHKKPYKTISDALLMGLIAYIFVAIATYGVAYTVQLMTNTPLVSQIPFIYCTYFFFLAFACYGSFKAWGEMRGLRKLYAGAQNDIKTTIVQEEAWRFINAASFHSPETNAYFLLLLSDSDEVLVFHGDKLKHENIMLYAPADMVLVRSIHTGLILKLITSGPTLTLQDHFVAKVTNDVFPAHGFNVTTTWGLNFKEAIAHFS